MGNILFLQYPKCSTCRKAAKWLATKGIQVENRDISKQPPTKEELMDWIEKSKLRINKFFNTSGKLYRENNLKEKVKMGSNDELLTILASDGMVVKRPIVISDNMVLVGFDENEWTTALK